MILRLSHKLSHNKLILAMFLISAPFAIWGYIADLVHKPMLVLLTTILGYFVTTFNERKKLQSNALDKIALLLYSTSIVIGVNVSTNDELWHTFTKIFICICFSTVSIIIFNALIKLTTSIGENKNKLTRQFKSQKSPKSD